MLDLPYIYSQKESNQHYYAYGECGTHMGIYGYTRAVLGDLYSVAKIGGLRFRCPGYFINHLVISIPPTHFKTKKFIFKPEWCVTLCDCAYSHSTVCTVSAVLCCATVQALPTLLYTMPPYTLYDHISLLVMCVLVYVPGRRSVW